MRSLFLCIFFLIFASFVDIFAYFPFHLYIQQILHSFSACFAILLQRVSSFFFLQKIIACRIKHSTKDFLFISPCLVSSWFLNLSSSPILPLTDCVFHLYLLYVDVKYEGLPFCHLLFSHFLTISFLPLSFHEEVVQDSYMQTFQNIIPNRKKFREEPSFVIS